MNTSPLRFEVETSDVTHEGDYTIELTATYNDSTPTVDQTVTFTVRILGCKANELTLTSNVAPNPYEYIIGSTSTDLSGVFSIRYAACTVAYTLNAGTFDNTALTFDTSSGVIAVFVANNAGNIATYDGTE